MILKIGLDKVVGLAGLVCPGGPLLGWLMMGLGMGSLVFCMVGWLTCCMGRLEWVMNKLGSFMCKLGGLIG